jgi:hypothetical protein
LVQQLSEYFPLFGPADDLPSRRPDASRCIAAILPLRAASHSSNARATAKNGDTDRTARHVEAIMPVNKGDADLPEA